MSNISSAKSSLRAELAHVQSGLAYYRARVDALSAAIDQLDTIGDEGDIDIALDAAMQAPKSRRGGKGRRAVTARKVSKPASHARARTRLPATGGDFFPDLITEQKQSMSDLLQAAATQMPFKATTEEMTQLRSRLVAAITHMLKSGKIRDEGKGRQRVYFRA